MRSALERRETILSILRVRRETTYEYLAREFKVTVRTIGEDIRYLMLNHYIRTETGAAGGVFYDGKSGSRQEFLTPRQIDSLRLAIAEMDNDIAESLADILLGFAPKEK